MDFKAIEPSGRGLTPCRPAFEYFMLMDAAVMTDNDLFESMKLIPVCRLREHRTLAKINRGRETQDRTSVKRL